MDETPAEEGGVLFEDSRVGGFEKGEVSVHVGVLDRVVEGVRFNGELSFVVGEGAGAEGL